MSDEISGLISPGFDVNDGFVARVQRWVSTHVARLFDRRGGPVEALVGFAVINLIGTRSLRPLKGWSGAISRRVFELIYTALTVPVGYAIIVLLGYRYEDRVEYPFHRGLLGPVYDAEVWRPISDWHITLAIGLAFFVMRVIAMTPLVILLSQDHIDLDENDPVLAGMLESQPELLKLVAMWVLYRCQASVQSWGVLAVRSFAFASSLVGAAICAVAFIGFGFLPLGNQLVDADVVPWYFSVLSLMWIMYLGVAPIAVGLAVMFVIRAAKACFWQVRLT